jgi:hypothetical protein
VRRRTEMDPRATMRTTTTMTPMTEKATARGPSLWPWTTLLACPVGAPGDAVVRCPPSAVACHVAPWAGTPPRPTRIQRIDAQRAMVAPTMKWCGRARAICLTPDESRLLIITGAPSRSVGQPSLTHEGIGIDVTLDVVDPLPFVEESLLREACKLGCPL